MSVRNLSTGFTKNLDIECLTVQTNGVIKEAGTNGVVRPYIYTSVNPSVVFNVDDTVKPLDLTTSLDDYDGGLMTVNTATGLLTYLGEPTNIKYKAIVMFQSVAATNRGKVNFYLYKNGLESGTGVFSENMTSPVKLCVCSSIIPVNTGDTLQLHIKGNHGTAYDANIRLIQYARTV